MLCWQADTGTAAGELQSVLINGSPLADFSIVYETMRNGYLEVAQRLRDLVKELAGCDIPVYGDDQHAENGKPEILIGKTNRALSAELYARHQPRLLTYQLVVQGNRMQILCGGPFSARECVDSFRYCVLSAGSVGNGGLCKEDLNTPSEFSEGRDLRIMTSNILAARWGEDYRRGQATEWVCPPVAQRAEVYAAVLASCRPDVIGVQETDLKWIQCLPQYLDILKNEYQLEYTWLFNDYLGKQTLTTVLFRSDKYRLLGSEIFNFSFWNNDTMDYNLRLLEWVRLQEKEVPAHEFILVNTHWAGPEQPAYSNECASREAETVKELYATYQVPVFCTGDFNSNQDSAEYQRFVAESGVQSTRWQAMDAGTLANHFPGCDKVGKPRVPGAGNYIDHIFGLGNYSVLRYETVLGKAIWISDHLPHIADIKF